jgi:nitrite reductase/ring-hydroxylating ferredoxin subunit
MTAAMARRAGSPTGVREDWVPKAPYIDPAYVRLEKERLWPRVWQVACREEEIPEPGDYVTFDVADESIIVVRLADGSAGACCNACQHRGRRLTEGCGSARHFFCQFHGWRWNLDGSLRSAVHRQDWGDRVADAELRLKSPRIDTWAGSSSSTWIPLRSRCATTWRRSRRSSTHSSSTGSGTAGTRPSCCRATVLHEYYAMEPMS